MSTSLAPDQTLSSSADTPEPSVGQTVPPGKIVTKPERVQAVIVEVPGTGKIVNVIVGGRGKSQGKYLLRVRLVDFQ